MKVFNRFAKSLKEKFSNKVYDEVQSPSAKRDFNEAAQAAIVPVFICCLTAGILTGQALISTVGPIALMFGAIGGGISGFFAAKRVARYMKKRMMKS